MESKNSKFDGFHDEELDPIVFAESEDIPELRESALAIPRPTRDEEHSGPKRSRAELLKNNIEELPSSEWVPADTGSGAEMETRENNLEKFYQAFGKAILFLIPIGIISVFILYASTAL